MLFIRNPKLKSAMSGNAKNAVSPPIVAFTKMCGVTFSIEALRAFGAVAESVTLFATAVYVQSLSMMSTSILS